MMFLIVGMLVAVALNRSGRISRNYMLLILGTSFISLMLGETKAAFLFLPITFVVFDLRRILVQPARLLGMILIGAPALIGMFKAYEMMYWESADSSYTGQDSSFYITHSFEYVFDPTSYDLMTGDVSRGAALAIWWTDPQADLTRRLIGYGPASSRSQSLTEDGVIAKRYRPLYVATHSAAELLWDVGVAGTLAFTAILVSAIVLGIRHLGLEQTDEERQLSAVATAMTVVLLATMIYNFTLAENPAIQWLLMLCIGTIHTFSARMIPERRSDNVRRRGAAVWGVSTSHPAAPMSGIARAMPRKRLRPDADETRLALSTGSTMQQAAMSWETVSEAIDVDEPLRARSGDMIKHTFWAAVGAWGTRATTFLVFAILTRLLPPEAFGLLAFVNVAHFLVFLFTSCFSEYLIVNQDATPDEEYTIFWLQLLLSSTAALSLGLAGYFWGPTWIDHPDASVIIALFACSIPFSAAAAIPEVLLRRRFAFKQVALRSLVASLLGGISGVILAIEGFGVWSLVWKQLIEAAIYVIINFVVVGWVPRFVFRRAHLGPPLRYGFGAATTWLVGSLAGRMDSLIIGPVLGSAALGYYTVGQRPCQMLWDLFHGVVMKVAYPHFAAIAADRRALTELHRKTVYHTMLIGAPAYAALGALAPQLIPLVFGSQWERSFPVLQVLCLASLASGLSVLSLDLLMASGRIRAALKLNLASLLLTAIFVYFGSRYGIVYAAAGIAAESLLTIPIGLKLAREASGLGLRLALRSAMPGLCAAAAIVISIGVAGSFLETESRLLQFLVLAAVGGAALLLTWKVVAPELFVQLAQHLRKAKRR